MLLRLKKKKSDGSAIHFIDHTISLRGNKVSMLTNTCPHKPLRTVKVALGNSQAECPFCLRSDISLVINKLKNEDGYA